MMPTYSMNEIRICRYFYAQNEKENNLYDTCGNGTDYNNLESDSNCCTYHLPT